MRRKPQFPCETPGCENMSFANDMSDFRGSRVCGECLTKQMFDPEMEAFQLSIDRFAGSRTKAAIESAHDTIGRFSK